VALSPDSTPASFQVADRYLAESVAPLRKALLAANMAQLETDINADPTRRFIHYSLRSGPRIWYDPAYDAAHLWQDVTVNPEMFDYVWGPVFQNLDITTGLEHLTQPVFVALGRYDYWNPPHLWEPVRHYFRDLHLRVFEQSGHTPQLEQPADFDREILSWLAEKG
jgi:proline iminopeptidase